MRTLNGLAWRNLMQRKLRTFLSVAGVALGVALVFAAASVAASAGGNKSAEPTDHVNTQVISSSGAYLDSAVADKARAVPGIMVVSPVLIQSAISAADASATLTLNGVEPTADTQVHTRTIVQGSYLSGDGQIVVPAIWATEHKLSVGDTLALLVMSGGSPLPGVVSVKIVGTLDTTGSGGLASEGFTTLATLQQAVGLKNKLSALDVRFSAGADANSTQAALKAALGSEAAFVAALDIDTAQLLNIIIDIVLIVGGCVILFTSAYLIFNTFAMTLAERRTDIGRLVALGMTPAQATRSVVNEALLIGAFGSLVGLALGAVLTIPVALAINLTMGKPFQWVPLSLPAAIISVVMGLFVTVSTTYPIARQAGKVSPLEMIFNQRSTKVVHLQPITRLGVALIGLGVLGLITIVVLAGANLNVLGITLLMGVGIQVMFLFGGLLIIPGLLVRWFQFLRRQIGMRLGLVTSLALSNLERQSARSALTASTLAIVVSATLMMAGMTGAIGSGQSGIVQNVLGADYMMLPGGGNTNPMMSIVSGKLFMPTDPKFFAAMDALKAKLSVARIALGPTMPDLVVMPGAPAVMITDIDVYIDQRGAPLLGATNDQIRATFAAGPSIIISQPVADRFHLKVGDPLVIDTTSGSVTFKVAAVDNRLFYSFLDYKQSQTALGGITPLGMLIKRLPGVTADEVLPALNDIGKQYGMEVINMSDFVSSFEDFYAALGAAFSGIGFLTMVIAALGILGTIYTSVMERRRELGVLAAVGGAPTQLRNMILVEAIILGLSGTIPGTLLGVFLSGISGPLNRLTVQAAHLDIYDGSIIIPWIPLIVTLIGAPLVALLAALIPARQIAKLQIVEALRYQ